MADDRVEIFTARRVIALTNADPEAFAVFGERIVAVGSAADLTVRFPDATLTDVGDGVIVPGFIDAHMHPSTVAEDLLNLDVSSTVVRSLSDLTRKVLDQAVATPPGTWIRGSRYDDAKMAEGRVLTRWDLDEVAPEHPVLIVQVAGHWAVVNSKALELGGLDDAAEAPPGGAYGRDGNGRLNGILYERALSAFVRPAGRRARPDAHPGRQPGGPARRPGAGTHDVPRQRPDLARRCARPPGWRCALPGGGAARSVERAHQHAALVRGVRHVQPPGPAHGLRERPPPIRRCQSVRGRGDRWPDLPAGGAVRGYGRPWHADDLHRGARRARAVGPQQRQPPGRPRQRRPRHRAAAGPDRSRRRRPPPARRSPPDRALHGHHRGDPAPDARWG